MPDPSALEPQTAAPFGEANDLRLCFNEGAIVDDIAQYLMFQPTNPLSTTWNQDIINELSAHAPSQAAREVHSEVCSGGGGSNEYTCLSSTLTHDESARFEQCDMFRRTTAWWPLQKISDASSFPLWERHHHSPDS